MEVLATERPAAEHEALDRYDTPALVAAIAGDQARAVQAVLAAGAAIAQAVEAAWPRLQAGGRLIYAGAGTSGRLGVLDSVELLPTFSWPTARAQALLAGGPGAMYVAVEGAEDDREQGTRDLQALAPGAHDVVIGLAASGTTPYVRGVLQAARAAGALTIGLANNPGTPVLADAECPVLLDTGAEIVSGSTRLKAGTAQKIALNTLSTALMVRLHKTYGNLMVDLRATNAKLRGRALRLTMLASSADETAARSALEACGGHVKTAIVMLRAGVDAPGAQARLEAAAGSVAGAVAQAG
ncbi:MAG: N-acetylmuramic acid 6-phosphate etherase [Pseudomonadota bacterium]